MAAAIERWDDFHFEKCLYVVASQQNLHFKQWFKVAELLELPFADRLYHIPFGLVSLEGKTLSTRKGEVVFLEDVLLEASSRAKEIIEEKGAFDGDIDKLASDVGIGAVVFNELSKDRIKDYTFSWEQILNFDGETGPYVQYTYARLCSIIRKAEIDESEMLSKSGSPRGSAPRDDGDNCVAPRDDERDDIFEIIKAIYNFDSGVEKAAKMNEPAILTRSILSLAKLSNRFYHNNKILSAGDEKEYLLAIVVLIKRTIKKGLDILGVAAPEKM
jgi:arginyl-tRNA synthetase